MNNTVFELTLRNDTRTIPEIASFIANSAKKLGLSKKKVLFLCFTIETALEYRVNAINDENSEIKIVVEDSGSYFKFSIIDFGSPYILTANQQTILKRKLVDKYSFEQRGRKGQCLSFIYKYDAKENPFIRKQEKVELLDEEFVFRKLKSEDEDILAAVTCLYDTYGYDYYHQHLYSVEAFKKYMSNGRYVPIIAENKHHQFMCYCALDENTWFLGVPELSNLVTNPIARGKGLASKMFNEAYRVAKEMNYEGIHVSGVAYHPYTQRMCNQNGYTPSAIEYSINPKGTGGYDDSRRLDCVIGVKIFNKDKKHELYLEEECNELFESIFNEEGLNYEIHNDVSLSNSYENLISHVVDTDTSNCFMKIDECGNDFKGVFNALLNLEEVKTTDVITVNLNMNNPSNIIGYRVLRDAGFICTGCIPGCKNGDFMLLQAFKVTPEYEKIVLEDNYKELTSKVYKLNKISI